MPLTWRSRGGRVASSLAQVGTFVGQTITTGVKVTGEVAGEVGKGASNLLGFGGEENMKLSADELHELQEQQARRPLMA